MIVLAGGSGRLGRILVDRLGAIGEPVRVLSRTPDRVNSLLGRATVEVVAGDVRDRLAVERALAGARIVISALSAFGMKGTTLRAVDLEGNLNLIAAAEKHGSVKFIFVSALRASARHPMELARIKYQTEQTLMQSKLAWTILRPSTFTETFQEALCAPLLDNRAAVVFGRGENPVNFVSAYDVARFVELAISDSALSRTALDIGGSENLSLLEFVDRFRSALGLTGPVKHIPRLAMKILSQLLRPFNPRLSRLAWAGALMDSMDMSFDVGELNWRFPQISLSTVAAVARRDYASRALAQALPT